MGLVWLGEGSSLGREDLLLAWGRKRGAQNTPEGGKLGNIKRLQRRWSPLGFSFDPWDP